MTKLKKSSVIFEFINRMIELKFVQVFYFLSFFCCETFQNTLERKAFDVWKNKFGKTYESSKVEYESLRHFSNNSAFVESHNRRFRKGLVSYSVGLW